MQTALVTGSAGFIGYYVCKRLLADGWRVIGVDSMSDYYDPALKQKRQSMLLQSAEFKAINDKIETPDLMMSLFAEFTPDVVIHLAAQAGVRYSIENPRSYLEANIIGTFEILEAARAYPPKHMLLASTSSAVQPADHDVPVLHGLRPLGTSRHGPDEIRQTHPRRRSHRCLQPRPDEA